jgi:hypothetical protein
LTEHCLSEEGKKESYGGTLKQFFAVHNMEELNMHREKWGSCSLSIRACKKIEGKQMEAQHSLTYHMADGPGHPGAVKRP